MKNRLPIIILTVLATFSCHKHDEGIPTDSSEPLIYSAITEMIPVKTSLDVTSVKWSPSDSIAGFEANGTPHISEKAVISNSEGTQASFTFNSVAGGASLQYFGYPSEGISVKDISSYTFNAKIPEFQEAAAGGFANSVNLAFAKGSGNELQFKNACAIVSVDVKNDNIKSITLEANEVIAGDVEVSLAGDVPVVTAANTIAKGITLHGSFINGNRYYFVLLPGTYTGMKLIFRDNSSRTAEFTNPNPLAISRNENISIFSAVIPDTKWQQWSVATVLGNAAGPSENRIGTGAGARLAYGQDIARGADGNYRITVRNKDHGIFMMTPDYTLSKVVTQAENSLLSGTFPWGCCMDSNDILYFCAKGTGKVYSYENGTLSQYSLDVSTPNTMKILADDNDNLYLLSRGAAQNESKIYKIKDNAILDTYSYGTGLCENMAFSFDKSKIFLFGNNTGRIKVLDVQTGIIKVVAGSGQMPTATTYTDGTPGNPVSATIGASEGGVCLPDGTLIFGDYTSRTIRRLTPGADGRYEAGTVETILGKAFGVAKQVDGSFGTAYFSYPNGMILTPDNKAVLLLDGTSISTVRRLSFNQ